MLPSPRCTVRPQGRPALGGASNPDRTHAAAGTVLAHPGMRTPEMTEGGARTAIEEVPLWYHTLELEPGIVTPGWFDLRSVVDLLPWPDVRGKRCLDVGTYDGFLAFELERRGAAEVVATDIPAHEDWDWPPRLRQRGTEYLAEVAGPEKGRGFAVAKELLGSSVERTIISVYDLDPDT